MEDPLRLLSTVQATDCGLNVDGGDFFGTLWPCSVAITGRTSLCTAAVHHFMTTVSHLLRATFVRIMPPLCNGFLEREP